jgi:hypothetical protein
MVCINRKYCLFVINMMIFSWTTFTGYISMGRLDYPSGAADPLSKHSVITAAAYFNASSVQKNSPKSMGLTRTTTRFNLVEDLKALLETDEETMTKKLPEQKDKRAVRKKRKAKSKARKKEQTKDSKGQLRMPLKAEGKTKSKARNPKGEFYFVGFYTGCLYAVINPLDEACKKLIRIHLSPNSVEQQVSGNSSLVQDSDPHTIG